MGERPDTILGTGCPSSDIARTLERKLASEIINTRGAGIEIDVSKPFLLVVFHPTTTEFGGEQRQMEVMMSALDSIGTQTLMLWPNIDAGSDHISKVIRVFRTQERPTPPWLRTLTNLTPENYLKVLATTACAVGNSSSFVRDAGYFGTPVVLVGNRQNGRETDEHVTRVGIEMDTVVSTIKKQLAHGRYKPSKLYGDGTVSQRIAAGLVELKPYLQKQLAFTLNL